SSSIRRTLSATARRTERRGVGVDDDRQRRREEARLERRVAPWLTVELHRTRRAFQHFDAHRAAAPEPQSPCAVHRSAHQLQERAQALPYAFGPEHDHIEPAGVRRDVVPPPKDGWNV